VAIIGRTTGRGVRFEGSVGHYLATRVAAGGSRDEAMGEAEAFAALRDRGDDEPNDVVRRVIGEEPTTFEAYVAGAAARGAWQT
jgi:hypothetical protein